MNGLQPGGLVVISAGDIKLGTTKKIVQINQI